MNNNNPFNNIFLLIVAGLLFSSCEKFIDYDVPEHTPKLVVISGFQPGEPWSIYVSHSLSSFDNEDFSPIQNAEVVLKLADGIYSQNMIYSPILERYISTGTAEAGKEYRIEVSAPGYPSVFAENKIPGPATLISLDTLEGFHNGDFSTDFELKFTNPAGEDNFFLIQLFSVETFDWKEQFENIVPIQSDDPNMDNVSDDEYGEDFLLLRDQNFDGKEYTFRFYTPNYSIYFGKGTQYKAKVFSCSEEFYRYQKTARQYQLTYDNPFSQPVQIFSNIENGIGIFGGFVVSEIEL
ncbi:MAG: DUF4249 domain-containing protein [Bacteroidales bacterium]|nr:DUF4249 domain-containing protein [Bacteroidales bacterium]MCF8458373.1 DUF4249 domain-containing protein [Bacteroidales bacterium]